MSTREPATVERATYGLHEHYQTLILEMMFKLPGGGQGFGGICLDEVTGPAMVAEVCALFGVATLEETVGRNCHILRCWPSWGEDIEGIEVDGQRWTLTAFRMKHWPEKTQGRLADRVEKLQRDIDRKAEEIRRDVQRLNTVKDGYIDWSAQTGSVDR